jgi:hypothetical protein
MGQMRRVCGNNTAVVARNGNTSIILHGTPVVEFDCECIILRTGGWRTVTTKSRMNQASNQYNLGYQVFQRHHDWFVSFKDKEVPFGDNEEVVLTR